MICVFDKFTKIGHFDTCGERILNPTKCMIHHDLNGDYSLQLEQPILPDDDCHKFLQIYNIIKTSNGQLFFIYWIQRKLVNNVPTVIVKAKHIFYWLDFKVVYGMATTGSTGWALHDVLPEIFNKTEWGDGPDYVNYRFAHSSDIYGGEGGAGNRIYEANGISVAKAVFECVDAWGAYLYRDNFKLSLNAEMENSKANAFTAIHGWNVTDVVMTQDYTDHLTFINAKDNFDNKYKNAQTSGGIAYQIERYLEFSYQDKSTLVQDGKAYFEAHYYPPLSYEMNLADLKDSSRALGWDKLEHVNVGDTGWVESDILGIGTDQRVVSVDYDDLARRNTSVKISNFQKSSLHPGRWDSTVSMGSTPETKRIAALEKKGSYFTYID